MKQDVLQEAVRALREQADEAPASPDATRARIMATFRQKRARRVTLVRTVLPLAAVIVGSLAWAAPGRLPAVWRAATSLLDATAPTAPAPMPQGAPGAVQGPSNAPADPALPALPEAPAPLDAPAPPGAAFTPDAEPAAPAPASSPVAALPASPPRPQAAPPSAAAQPARSSREQPAKPSAPSSVAAAKDEPADPASKEHALYKEAHRLHFVDHNPSAALGAWETYLRAEPRGRFSTEARYNRALCLVRLGRAAEARSALEAFARGAFGGYRQAEARALLEAIHETIHPAGTRAP